ncbi:MAG: sensor histidine kinase [Planctomycetota bacterium]|jgi:signal transduction histidine kinase
MNAKAPGKHLPIRTEDTLKLSRAILRCANRGLPRTDFLGEVSDMLLSFSGCDAIEIRLSDAIVHYRWEAVCRPEPRVRFQLARWIVDEDGTVIPADETGSDLEGACQAVARRNFDSTLPCFTKSGSFWTGNPQQPCTSGDRPEPGRQAGPLCVGGRYPSLALVRFVVDDKTVGLLLLKSAQTDYFAEHQIEVLENLAQTLGLAIADRRAQAALRERMKELTCLYGIARLSEQADCPLDEMLRQIVELLPAAWQYPEIAAARITLDDASYATAGFRKTTFEQRADIVVGDLRRGTVEVVYLGDRPEFPVSAFLPEEEHLIDAVAREISLIVERREAQHERSELQRQLIHADRLATIGQLAAGVAHELNEPLGSILGFAQLAEKCPGLPAQAQEDTKRIIGASLYAREVIKKLLVFARQLSPSVAPVCLNRIVAESLYFLEARCAKAGIEVVRDLAPDLPDINADPSQLNQVLVNLVVNAVQAMPEGGTLTIGTRWEDSKVVLLVEDTGIGISHDIKDKIFLPFFSTKDVEKGTGLGLAVVHGIVSSHGGSIDVESRPSEGSRFTVQLPVRN